MGILKYYFNVSAQQKQADKQEYQELQKLVQVAYDKMCEAHSGISYMCRADEHPHSVVGKCLVNKVEHADFVVDETDVWPYRIEYKCPHFNECMKCSYGKCGAIPNNHKYIDAQAEYEYLKWQKRFFWSNKYAKAK